MRTNLNNLTGQSPLFHAYPGADAFQPAHIELALDGTATYEWDTGEADDDILYNRIIRIPIPNFLTAQGYNDLHEKISERLDIISHGFHIEWNGTAMVGVLSENAQRALTELLQEAESKEWEAFDHDTKHLADRWHAHKNPKIETDEEYANRVWPREYANGCEWLFTN